MKLLALAQKQPRRSVGFPGLIEDGVPLLGGGPRNVAGGFVAAQANQQGLPRSETIESDAGPDEGHWTDVSGDVDGRVGDLIGDLAGCSVGGRNGIHDTCPPHIYKNNHCETAARTLI